MKVIALGCGNMASAIIKGAYQKLGASLEVWCYTPSQIKAQKLAAEVKGSHIPQLDQQLPWSAADMIMIGCKPQQVQQLSDSLKGILPANLPIISILAGTPLEKLQQLFGSDQLTRIMPSTPTLVGQGISLIMHSASQSQRTRDQVNQLFGSCSYLHLMQSESDFDLATTVAACGPAYIFNFARALAQGLTSQGFDPVSADKIVRELFVGSSALMQSSAQIDLLQLQEQVTSKGGITWEAIKVFDHYNLGRIASEAISAALKRTEELKKLN